jgi:hypothetical protein
MAMNFVDTGWRIDSAAFGTNGCPLQPKTPWAPNSVLYLRDHFALSSVSALVCSVAIDNDFMCWFNGDSVYSNGRENCATMWDFSFTIPKEKTVVGENVIAVKASDRGFATYFDAKVNVLVIGDVRSIIANSEIPTTFALYDNYTNPFNPSTTIRYGLPNRAHVTLSVLNTLGQQVATLVQGQQEAGSYEVKFDGSALASGVYFYRLQTGSFVDTKKLLLIR